MATGSKKRKRRNPATRLTDDLIVEILSRLPVNSICRFRSVSQHWRGLISHPDSRKRLPQTVAGFFYQTTSSERFPESTRHFTNVTGWGEPLIHPSLSFLPGHARIDILDSCNGLLLCRNRTAARYVVCNPATEEWTELPESRNICVARLGFDPAVSPHFHVFELVWTEDDTDGDFVDVDGLEIYSSETREWAFRDSGGSGGVHYDRSLPSTVFLNGFLHVFESDYQDVVAVDTEGKVWRTIPLPWLSEFDGSTAFIGQSQGRLYYLNTVEDDDPESLEFKLNVFVLDDYASNNWVLKHIVNTSKLIGVNSNPMHRPIAIHPECNLIFFVSDWDNTIRCYNMDSREVHVIRNMGQEDMLERCLPYVPLFLESTSGWN